MPNNTFEKYQKRIRKQLHARHLTTIGYMKHTFKTIELPTPPTLKYLRIYVTKKPWIVGNVCMTSMWTPWYSTNQSTWNLQKEEKTKNNVAALKFMTWNKWSKNKVNVIYMCPYIYVKENWKMKKEKNQSMHKTTATWKERNQGERKCMWALHQSSKVNMWWEII